MNESFGFTILIFADGQLKSQPYGMVFVNTTAAGAGRAEKHDALALCRFNVDLDGKTKAEKVSKFQPMIQKPAAVTPQRGWPQEPPYSSRAASAL